MPDGDLLNPFLNLRYQNSYKQICEGALSSEEQARRIAKCIRRDLIKSHQKTGAAVTRVIEVLESLMQKTAVMAKSERECMDWREQCLDLRRAVSNCQGKREKEIIVCAAQQVIGKIQNGEIIDNVSSTFCLAYSNRFYASSFGDNAASPEEHYDGVSTSEVSARIRALDPYMSPHLDNFGSQLHQWQENGGVGPPQLKNLRHRVDPIDDLNADIGDVLR